MIHPPVGMSNSTLVLIVALLAALAVVLAAAFGSRRRSQLRRVELQQRFGPEYDRAVQEFGSPARAERVLASRARRVDHLRLRELSAADRSRFASQWSHLQALFVDDPAAAVVGANALIKEVMRVRGYPADDFDQRVADLSVAHPDVVQHYRAARALSESAHSGTANTEELRQAVVHYRALFADLLQEVETAPRSLREVHA